MKRILFLLCNALFTFSHIEASFEDDESAQEPIYSSFLNGLASVSKESIDTKLVNIFQRWVKHTMEKLESESTVIQTASGPIEYVKKGSGPVVLCLHGGFGGYDQAKLIGDTIVENGFTLLAPSRPGYLRTPLFVGETPEQQADAMVNLLNALKIDRVAVVGFSAGCPVAYQMALRYPNIVWGLALECLGSQTDQGPIYDLVVEVIDIDEASDFASWLLYLATRSDFRGTAEFVLSLDNTMSSKLQRQREHYVLEHSSQSAFLKKLILSTLPLGPRKNGIVNDINNLDPWKTPGYLASYSLIKTPTIIIESMDDSNGNYQEAVFVSQQMNAQLVSVGNSGHFIWLGERTKQWENLLIRFLKNYKP